MAYKDFRGNDIDVSGWSDARINNAMRTHQITRVEDAADASPAKTKAAKTTAKTTSKKTAAKSTARKSSKK